MFDLTVARTVTLIGVVVIASTAAEVRGGCVPQALEVTATASTRVGAVAARVSRDGSKLYVIRRGPPVEHQSAGGEGFVDVLDATTLILRSSIYLGAGFPMKLALSKDGSRLLVTISCALVSTVSNGASRLAIVDTETDRSLQHVFVPGDQFGAAGLAVDPDGRTVWVTDRGAAVVASVDIPTAKLGAWIRTGTYAPKTPTGIAVSPDGARIYAAHRNDATVTVIDRAQAKPVSNIQLSLPRSGSFASVAMSADGHRLYVALDLSTPKIAVVDTDPASPTFHREVATISTAGWSLQDLALSPQGCTLYVCSARVGDDRLLAVDVDPSSPHFHEQVTSVRTGSVPSGVAPAEAPRRAHVVASGEPAVQTIGGGAAH